MATIDDARAAVRDLPRSYEALVRDSVRFRVGSLVYAGFTRDETLMGFAFPKELRDGLVGGDPDRFQLPRASDLRFNWVVARLATLDGDELAELLVDAWVMCVPKKVSSAHLLRLGGVP